MNNIISAIFCLKSLKMWFNGQKRLKMHKIGHISVFVFGINAFTKLVTFFHCCYLKLRNILWNIVFLLCYLTYTIFIFGSRKKWRPISKKPLFVEFGGQFFFWGILFLVKSCKQTSELRCGQFCEFLDVYGHLIKFKRF